MHSVAHFLKKRYLKRNFSPLGLGWYSPRNPWHLCRRWLRKASSGTHSISSYVYGSTDPETDTKEELAYELAFSKKLAVNEIDFFARDLAFLSLTFKANWWFHYIIPDVPVWRSWRRPRREQRRWSFSSRKSGISGTNQEPKIKCKKKHSS